MKRLVDRLKTERMLPGDGFAELLTCLDKEAVGYLYESAVKTRLSAYGRDIYIRGLIEFTNHCKNDCYYCGIRRSNTNARRFRLSAGEILNCCDKGYDLGFRTFVLQGGEDPFFTDDRLCEIIKAIKSRHQDCAVTLSIGERSRESYQALFNAGADRYLLRHETANGTHYGRLHPRGMSLESRIRCLYDLKEIGYQTGCGFMVGSPCQTVENLIEDLMFIHDFHPQMVGIGPFIPHRDTPFRSEPAGSMELTLRLLAIIRLMLPDVLLPATTALGTIALRGRELGIVAGANVVMPNLSPIGAREKYLLYDGKLHTGAEAAESLAVLKQSMESIGYSVVTSRGDHKAE